MNHKWKLQGLSDVIKYNKYLLVALLCSSVVTLCLSYALIGKEERFVVIPMNDTSQRIEVSNTRLYPSYLKPWASYIAKEIFTTSPESVIEQHAQIRKVSDSNKKLEKFFAKQLKFVQGSDASSVFYVKNMKMVSGGVVVRGTLHYWFGGNASEKLALEKSYLISYREEARGLILLENIEEIDGESIKELK
jgi:hypothetical protein